MRKNLDLLLKTYGPRLPRAACREKACGFESDVVWRARKDSNLRPPGS